VAAAILLACILLVWVPLVWVPLVWALLVLACAPFRVSGLLRVAVTRFREAFMEPTATDRTVKHRFVDIDGVNIFYREAGRRGSPALLLPHGYPCSSYEFRNLMPPLADRWHLIAPDFPGFGYSDTPPNFETSCTFAGYTEFLKRFVDAMGIDRYALYLHDYGSQIGLRVAIANPERITALIIQNGDIYRDVLGPKYAGLLEYFDNPTAERRAVLEKAVSEEGFREEFLNSVRPSLAERIPPELWTLAATQLGDPRRQKISVSLMEGLKENLNWFPRYQSYLREHQPPALIVWGPQDGYMPEASARAYLRDLPRAELHFLDAGHWALETNLDEVVGLMRDFLARSPAGP
jgi:pimeloyl-ACP methyl ester carboxylesterase